MGKNSAMGVNLGRRKVATAAINSYLIDIYYNKFKMNSGWPFLQAFWIGHCLLSACSSVKLLNS
jgi:hypothetical protein